MNNTILFYDNVCPKPYASDTLSGEPIGGTEATVIRVADRLYQNDYDVYVEQHCRKLTTVNDLEEAPSATYAPPGECRVASHVVCLRDMTPLEGLRRRFPDAKLYLWLHDTGGLEIPANLDLLANLKVTILTVSNAHKTQIIDLLRLNSRYQGQVQVKRIYNPIDDELKPEGDYNPNKLVFFSSPHKGLEYTLSVFKNLLSFNPDFKLYVANPGYYPDLKDLEARGSVVNLGQLPHHEVIRHVREALCVFHLNHVFPETFGLVYAEANAVGTPCLTHSLGATYEVLDHPQETVDTRNPKAVIDRVMNWHKGYRPIVRGKPEFRLSNVAKQWAKVLEL